MIRTAIVGAVVALLIGAATALSFQAALSFQEGPAIEIAVDLDTTGNTSTTIGATDACRSVNVGDTFDFDVLAKKVPAPDSNNLNGGVAGFGLNVHFDPAVINLTAAVNRLWVKSDAPFERIAANYTDGGSANGFPATTGDTRTDFVNLGLDSFAIGDGILTRFTAKAVAAGQSTITVDSEADGFPYPNVLRITSASGDSATYAVSNQQNALVTVGEPCENPPPSFDPEEPKPATPTPAPTLAPGESPTPTQPNVPAGDTKLAIDVVTTGNSATTVGPIDTCASAKDGDKFQVDVVISGVKDLLAWEVPITFNKDVLRVEDRDVKLFQQANAGSNVFDASNQTPNDTGVYVASASDLSDPVTPDSGSGVLVRLTFSAVGTGISQLSMNSVDIDGDGRGDKGILLKNVGNAIIGDNTADTYFDGPAAGAEIRVGSDCPSNAQVAPAEGGSSSSSSSSDTWVWVAIAAGALAIVSAAGVGVLLMRRRRTGGSP